MSNIQLILAIVATIAAIIGAIAALVSVFVAVVVNREKLKKVIRIPKNLILLLLVFTCGPYALWVWTRPAPPPPPPVASIVYDFENEIQGWGEHPENGLHISKQGVEVYCDEQSPISKTGDYSLKFTPTKIVNKNAYVTVLENAQESIITAHIFVPRDADINTNKACSTAKIIVWDKKWKSHESEYIDLSPGAWRSIKWDLRAEDWPGPWREFGIHFWFATDYRGPIYIDTVTLEK